MEEELLEQPAEQQEPTLDPSFMELVNGKYQKDFLTAINMALDSQAQEIDRYLAYRELREQAERVKARYPDFDLERELEDPRFARLVENGVEPGLAYDVVHRREQDGLNRRLAQNAARPLENGLAGGSAAVSKADPRTLTRAERRQLRRRAARGEEIVW